SNTLAAHSEIMLGGLAIKLGSAEVWGTAFDPVSPSAQVRTNGSIRFSSSDGERLDSYLIVPDPATFPGYFGKAGGLGEPSLLCDLAPIEVGNRFWIDRDGDGIQDPNEAALEGVNVQLITSVGTVLSESTTDSNGNYYFSSQAGTSTASARYGISGLTSSTTGFKIRASLTQNVLSNYLVTSTNIDTSSEGDIRDSDCISSGQFAVIQFDTGRAGQNDHSLDCGFYQSVGIGDYVWFDVNRDGVQDSGEPPFEGVTVSLLNSTTSEIISTKLTDEDGYYHFTHSDGVEPNTNYKIVLNNNDDFKSTGVLFGFTLTSQNSGSNDSVDSDATLASGNPTILATAPGPNEIDNSFDFGFIVDGEAEDLGSLLTTADGSIVNLSELVLTAYKARRSAGTEGKCEIIPKGRKVKRANALHYNGWFLVSERLPQYNYAGQDLLPDTCVVKDLTDRTKRIRRIARKLRRLVKFYTRGCNTSGLQKIARAAQHAYSSVRKSLKSYPKKLTSCGEP
ncbi:MAG: hypothetical protein KDD53_09930, partial [Bdellovibrionales bacterium]|nr:hypothetical protein [Bdellovibrionales bacterium]